MDEDKGSKRYYWLKLQHDFFTSKRIKKLRKLAGGDTYLIIYLKMQLLSLKTDGVLEYSGLEETFAKEIALDIDEDPDNVQVTLNYLLQCGLCIGLNGDVSESFGNVSESFEKFSESFEKFSLPFVKSNIGTETATAQKMRDFRANLKREKMLPCDNNVSQCYNNVTQCYNDVTQCYNIVTESKSKSKSKEKEEDIEIEIEGDKKHIVEIVDYLNQVCGTHYKASSKIVQKHVPARLKEGYTVDDFKTVIDKKSMEWSGTDMEKYLQPDTLFGTKFEKYLNQKTQKSMADRIMEADV